MVNRNQELLGEELDRVVRYLPCILYRLEAFEMWVWRRLEKVSWEDKVSNEEVLEAVVESRRIVDTIVRRKKNWIGHVVRGDGLLKLVLEGRMENKRARGRTRIGMIDDLMEG